MNQKTLFLEEMIVKKPFLRWTGGKNWLIPKLSKIVSKINYNNYHEPFIGGGSVFFALNPKEKSFLSDINFDLINCYTCIKNSPEKVIQYLSLFKQNKDEYYKLRDQKFDNIFKEASKFIYLNKTSFNGIYRVNSEGKYNVPYGNKSFNIEILEKLINSGSNQLKNTVIKNQDFKKSLDLIKPNDLVFLDPPYTITHNNNGFIKYNEKLFSIDEQHNLSSYIDNVISRDAYFILSNAFHPDVKSIYTKENTKRYILERKSVISGKKTSRNIYKEYLFTNIT